MDDLVGGTICNGCGQSRAHAPGIGYFCPNAACTYELELGKAMLQQVMPVDPRDARIQALETALAEARNAALEEAAKACEAERLSEPQDESDAAYDRAIDHCAQAIRDMKTTPDAELLDRMGNGKEGV